MGVGITYTGVDGRSTSFNSSSASDAIERLSRIPGYAGNNADRIAAGLASGWRERHKAAAKQRMGTGPIPGLTSNDIHASRNGVASGVSAVSGISVENGKIRTVSQKRYIDGSGSTVGIGPKRESLIDVSKMVGDSGKEIENAREIANAINGARAEKLQVVTGISFVVGESGLDIVVSKSTGKVLSLGESSQEKIHIGESLMVHEDVGTGDHSQISVLYRKKLPPHDSITLQMNT